jgi:hypothetical protein
MRRLTLPLVVLAAIAQNLAAQVPAQEVQFGPGLVRFHLARSAPSMAWTVGRLVYEWQSSWGSAVCIRFMAEPPGSDSVRFRIPQIDSLEVAVDSAGGQVRARQAQSARVVWVPYPLATLRRADAPCPEP